MATYTVTNTQFGAYEKSLTANTVDTVSFSYDRIHMVSVQVSSGGPVSVTLNGTTPTVNGANSVAVVHNGFIAVINDDAPITAVKLIAGVDSKYSVSVSR